MASFFGLWIVACLVLAGCSKSKVGDDRASGGEASGKGGRAVAFLPKGPSRFFWNAMEQGARQAGDDLGAEILWRPTERGSDAAEQAALVEKLVGEGVGGIVIAPIDAVSLLRPVKAAMRKNVPVVVVDSPLKGDVGKEFVSFVGTNNREAGRLAAEELVKLLGGKGNVALLRFMKGSASTMEREEGFLEVMRAQTGIHLLGEENFGGPSATDSEEAALAMLAQVRGADGVFCSNEPTTFGMLLTLRKKNLLEKVKVVGFDFSPALLEAVERGEIRALVLQNPVKMGSDAVKTLVAHMKGEEVPQRVPTAVMVVTPSNATSVQVKHWIHGDVK